jgi:hypothetical protein
MARRRDEDEDDDRPRRRRREEDDEDERPRRRSRRDDEDDHGDIKRRRRGDDGPFDEPFADSPLPLLIGFSLFCVCIDFAMSLLVLITGKHPVARKNAQVCLIASAVAGVVWTIGYIGFVVLMHR